MFINYLIKKIDFALINLCAIKVTIYYFTYWHVDSYILKFLTRYTLESLFSYLCESIEHYMFSQSGEKNEKELIFAGTNAFASADFALIRFLIYFALIDDVMQFRKGIN